MAEAALTPAQHEARSKGVGSSDAAAAVGLSPWKSRAELWAEKTGRITPPNLDDLEHIKFGNWQEESIARYFANERGKKVMRRSQSYVRDYMVANVDRLIVGEDAVLECKNVSEWGLEDWEGPEENRGPLYYRIQVHHQLVTAQKQYGVLAAFVGGNKYRDAVIQHDPEIAEMLIAREGEFWSYVERDVPPPVSTAEEVLVIYQTTKDRAINATAELVELHRELMALREDSKRIDSRIDALKDIVCSYLKDAEVLLGPDGKPLVTWRQAKGSTRVNYEQAFKILAEKVDEETSELALSASTYQTKGSRRFLPKEIKQ